MINIDARSSTPIYEQISFKIKELILKGVLRPGDKLPSVREMAVIITANPNTVSKAYSELEREKAIETIRGRGTFVAMDYKPKIVEEKMDGIKEEMKKIILEAKYMGISKEEMINMLSNFYEDLNSDK